MTLGFDVKARQWATSNDAAEIPGCEGLLSVDAETLEPYSSDFGGVVESKPGAVLRATHAKHVAAALRFCQEHGIDVCARAYGQSGNGESQVNGGLVVDMRGLASIDEVGPQRLTVGAGATWRALVAESLPRGWAPPVLTNHINVSVGGSITIGGLGVASHRHGLQADTIVELEVATLMGDVVTCSLRERPDLFRSVLAGVGQFGIVTRVSMASIPVPDEVMLARVHYETVEDMVADTFDHARRNRVDAIDNLTRMERPEENEPRAIYNDLSFFVYGGGKIDLAAMLGTVRGRVETRSCSYRQFVDLQDEYIDFITNVPIPKPWCAVVVPETELLSFIAEDVGPLLDFPNAGTVGMFVQPIASRTIANAMFRPRSTNEWFAILGLIRVMPPPAVPHALAQHEQLLDAVLARGGTLYPYGSVELSPDRWRRLLGARFTEVVAQKRLLDPKGILNPGIGFRDAVRGA